MKRYLASLASYKLGVEEIEIERETDSYYWVRGGRNAKHTTYNKMFDTFEEAKEFLLSIKLAEIESSEGRTKGLREEFEKISKLMP